MSGYHRQSPYSRRGDDDRQYSMDSRDGRRDGPRASRDSSSSYRGRDLSRDGYDHRDRDRDREPPRDAPQWPGRAGSRQMEAPPPVRRDSSVALSTPNRPSASDTAQMVDILKSVSDLISEQAAIRVLQESYDKMDRQRQMEFDKSQPKHANFPSVPELQGKYRMRDKKHQETLNRQQETNQNNLQTRLMNFVDELLVALPLGDMKNRLQREATAGQAQSMRDLEFKFSSLKNTGQQQHESSKKSIESLKEKLDQMKKDIAAIHPVQEKPDAVDITKIELVRKEFELGMKKQKSELSSSFQAQLDEQKKFYEGKLEKQQEEYRKDLQQLRDDFTSKLAGLETKQTNQESVLSKLPQHAAQIAELQSFKKESAAKVDRIPELLKSHQECQGEVDELLSKVASFSTQLAELKVTIQGDRTTLAEIKTDSGALVERVDAMEKSLSGIDLTNLEALCEFYAIEWLQYKAKIDECEEGLATVRSNIEDLPRMPVSAPVSSEAPENLAIADQVKAQFDVQMAKSMDSLATIWGTMIDNLRKDFARHDSLIKGVTTDVQSLSKTCVGFSKQQDQYGGYLQQFVQRQAAAEKRMEDADKVSQFHTMSITNLDTRFNNLTTKEVAMSIIGHLENFYPNANQINLELKSLKECYSSVKRQLDESKDVKGRLGESINVKGSPRMRKVTDIQGDPMQGSKRRRVEESPTGYGDVNGEGNS